MTNQINEKLLCGAKAAQRLAPYEAKISGNFEMPMHVGKLIACWDRPQFVSAPDARHMRADDYVVGLVYQGHARAYPLWVTDNYHMINDRIAGDAILFSTCERCQSGSAFISKLNGQEVKFSAMGMYNASLTMVNRKRNKNERHSLWLHYEGVAIDGPEKGHFLEQLPTFHMNWQDWVEAHPDTDVMLAPDDPHHRDARHGHGREEFFSRPGMDPPLAKTITGSFDHRYPENELVIGINIDAGIRAYPLLEIKRKGGVINDQLGDIDLVVLQGPREDQVTLAAYARQVAGRTLSFKRENGLFYDNETGSSWTIEGRSVAGELTGQQLQPLRWQYVRWHAWVYPHPSSELYQSQRALTPFQDFPVCPQTDSLRPVLVGLAQTVESLQLSHIIVDLALPHCATEGLCVFAGQDRLNLYNFTSAADAQDYVELQGALFCMPFDMKHARKRALRLGSFVLESDPTHQYAEPTQTVHYPDNETSWSKLVAPDQELPAWAKALATDPDVKGHFMALIAYLKQKRYDVVECAFLPHSQQRPGTLTAISATIEADRFAIYYCENEQIATRVANEVTHALQAGNWVLRSTPVLMYQDPHYEMGQLPDKKITWSPLLNKERFRNDIEEYVQNFLGH
ncbi:DUF3179 domain-containing (seleno)protein [Planctomycetota bacterium]